MALFRIFLIRFQGVDGKFSFFFFQYFIAERGFASANSLVDVILSVLHISGGFGMSVYPTLWMVLACRYVLPCGPFWVVIVIYAMSPVSILLS